MPNQERTLEEVLKEIGQSVLDWEGLSPTSPNDRASTGDYPLHKVAIWGDVQGADVLLNNGADINCRGEDDDTPLHRAVAGLQLEMVEFLLSRGADPRQNDMYGYSAWSAARMTGNQALLSLFQS